MGAGQWRVLPGSPLECSSSGILYHLLVGDGRTWMLFVKVRVMRSAAGTFRVLGSRLGEVRGPDHWRCRSAACTRACRACRAVALDFFDLCCTDIKLEILILCTSRPYTVTLRTQELTAVLSANCLEP